MPDRINRIIVTGDILRQRISGGASQTENILWLFHQVRPALETVCHLPILPITFTGQRDCVGRRLYSANGLTPGFDSWMQMLEKDPDARDLGIVFDEFEGSLVVGFELPDILRAAFDELDIPYLDITIHPVRFLDDLLLGLRSNLPAIQNAVAAHIVGEAEIQIGAGYLLASLAKAGSLGECTGSANIALFAGQTNDDRVLVRNGRFLSVNDYIGKLEQICRDHERVLVKPHPYAPTNRFVTALTRLYPNTSLVSSNFYHLLAQPNVTHVYSLASSTSIEAKYFRKQGVHLADYPYTFSDRTDGQSYISVHPDLHLPRVWHGILRVLDVDVLAPPVVRDSRKPSRTRHSLRSHWGADILECIA